MEKREHFLFWNNIIELYPKEDVYLKLRTPGPSSKRHWGRSIIEVPPGVVIAEDLSMLMLNWLSPNALPDIFTLVDFGLERAIFRPPLLLLKLPFRPDVAPETDVVLWKRSCARTDWLLLYPQSSWKTMIESPCYFRFLLANPWILTYITAVWTDGEIVVLIVGEHVLGRPGPGGRWRGSNHVLFDLRQSKGILALVSV